MVPLVALLALAPSPVDQSELNRRLVAEAERLLAAFDVLGPYDAKFVGPVVTVGSDQAPTMTSCSITVGDGRRYLGFLRNASGRLFALDFRKEGDHSGSMPEREPGSRSPIAEGARAAAVISQVAPPLPLLPLEGEYLGWRYAQDSFFFPIAVRERRFLVPSLGYGLTLDAKTGEVVRYTAEEGVPPLDEAPVRLSKADAVASARRLLVDDAPQPYVDRIMKPWTSYAIDPDASHAPSVFRAPVRLGWFLPEGARAARLAWKVPYWENHHATRGTKGSLLAIMIDVNTGERLPSKTLSGNL